MATLGFLLVILLAFFSQVHGLLIPGPDAKHPSKGAVASFALVDKSRKDPWDGGDRKIMVSLFMPVPASSCSSECEQPYMGRHTAEIANEQFFGDKKKGVFEKMGFNACCSTRQSTDASKIPVVVLEPQTDTSRLLYVNLARYMTANNVAVVLIDHPHDSSVTEFPGSDTAFNSGSTGLSSFSPLTAWNETITKAIDIRVQDIKFALESLKDSKIMSDKFVHVKFSSALDTSHYSVVGHGLGGTVATSLAISDPRVQFSINLSGSVPPLDHNIATPTYFLGRADFKRQHDINWPVTWSHLTGPATEYDLHDSDTFDFSDLSVVTEVAKNEGKMSDLQPKKLGSVGPPGSHAVKCFVEAIIKDELHNDDGGLRHCIDSFGDKMVPYFASLGQAVKEMEKESRGVSRRGVFRAAVRHRMEGWGFM
ncbi:hypothetical protein CC86DRAFT_201720 [Ophiobolus disseminans]|uniref:1-alkyl-2-acetylglycerophosphocholine esterase n=1 Tax=Ophiobolus disseminans TaxID=1469910 RepID=A0A6A7A597_9PLEO|nr:hypothetical protein CC86DRAFT_201720 [Ophiobolus disseminans]